MLRNIRNLILVKSVIRVSDIHGFLPRILEFNGSFHRTETEKGITGSVHALDIHRSEIQHRPPELLSARIGYNLILHLVPISVSAQVQFSEGTCMAIISGLRKTGIGLPNSLGAKGGAGGVRIIQIIERGHPERAFGESPHE